MVLDMHVSSIKKVFECEEKGYEHLKGQLLSNLGLTDSLPWQEDSNYHGKEKYHAGYSLLPSLLKTLFLRGLRNNLNLFFPYMTRIMSWPSNSLPSTS